MGKLLISSVMIILASWRSCEREKDADIQPRESIQVVVDATLTSEYRVQQIVLAKPVGQLNQKPQPVTGAVVSISDGQEYISFEEQSGAGGIYFSSQKMTVTVDKTYSLSINIGGNYYYATARAIPITPFVPVTYREVTQPVLRYEISENFASEEQAEWEVLVDWSSTPECPQDGSRCQSKMMYYTLHTSDVSRYFSPPKEKVYFPKGSLIIERKYSITPQHAAFCRAMLAETEWKGGFFDEASANVPSNLSEGAAGYFAVCMVIADTVVVR